jgi:hypothetical protein
VQKKLIPLAICYDFDGTLVPGNMQERDFIPKIGMVSGEFWDEVRRESERNNADNILVYMGLMLERAQAAKVPVRQADIRSYGSRLRFFRGVRPYKERGTERAGWFDRINAYGRASGVDVEHYIISSGIREMILGSKIGNVFKAVFASSFWYDHNGVAKWPALALNYTTKTQYLFRINKGSLDVHDHTVINRYVPKDERAVPFDHMVFLGDGETDIPCFRLVKDQGGHSIAVYDPGKSGARATAERLAEEGRIGYLAPADYRELSTLDRIVKGIIDTTASKVHLRSLSADG